MLVDVLTSAASWSSEHSQLTYLVPAEMEADVRPGQLVAIPYGERLTEGIVWCLRLDEETFEDNPETQLRPLHTIIDHEPALLPHQMALAEWIAEYYVTPLAQVALMMLPPGLVQRSRYVLRLAEGNEQERAKIAQEISPRLRALIGLLLDEGNIDLARLQEMLGKKKTKELLKEIKQSDLVERAALLETPRAKVRIQSVVRLIAPEARLKEWRELTEQQLQQYFTVSSEANMAFEQDQRLAITASSRERKNARPNPWALPDPIAIVVHEPQEKESLATQHRLSRQLAAINLLELGVSSHAHWTPNKLCKASGLTRAQLQQLVREKIIAIEEAEIRRDPLRGQIIPASTPLQLTTDQQQALEYILGEHHPLTPILLHGITGSGKTEIYLQALAAIIAQGKRGIMLVPEIALTTQAVQRVAARFPQRVAIIHSELGIGERYDEWRRIRSGQVDVVIGSRSALFSPLPDLGMIIIDEEHEAAYKQAESRPTYHTRDAAIMLGRSLHIPIVLGSATPSVTSFYHANQGNYHLIELRGRIMGNLPPVEVIDLRNELHAGNTSIISRRLQEEIEHTIEQRQQVILFLNRRGAASCVLCRDCGFVAICDRCDIPFTYHATERLLLCHYCGRKNELLRFCPQCKSSGMRYFGVGTEKVQATIQRSFPTARLLRWDHDTARNRHDHQRLLDSFANREADILIGTQMIAKGLDLPGVTLVGVVSADIALNLPDYAASERTFTLLTQVAGRAGRGLEPGRVIIQTFNPQHFCIDAASRHGYHEFYETEIEARHRYRYPPFCQFVKFTYSHENRHRCQNEALLLCERLNEWIERLGLSETDIVGPAPASMERMRNKYRWQMIVRGPELHQLLRVTQAPGWQIDIDPVSTL